MSMFYNVKISNWVQDCVLQDYNEYNYCHILGEWYSLCRSKDTAITDGEQPTRGKKNVLLVCDMYYS